MSDNDPVSNHDLAVRTFVYQQFGQTARPPTVMETAVHFHLPPHEIEKSYQRLHDNHFFFLEPGTLDVRMANPFSALPTQFRVQVGPMAYWANCAWDMLGIPAALHHSSKCR
ncbi:MAG: organomercurial lyase [Chloroflexota bacterium]